MGVYLGPSMPKDVTILDHYSTIVLRGLNGCILGPQYAERCYYLGPLQQYCLEGLKWDTYLDASVPKDTDIQMNILKKMFYPGSECNIF